ncbi:MAG: hypothetical protein AAF629_00090 [Chloroflexota bacterium]
MKSLFKNNKLVKSAGITFAALAISVVTIVGVVSAQEPAEGEQNGRRGFRGNSELHAYLHSEDVKADMQSAIAEVLGLTVAELEAAKENGQSIRDLAEENNVDLATLSAAKLSVKADALADAVADGIISQDEADQMLERFENRGNGGRRGGRGNGPRTDSTL